MMTIDELINHLLRAASENPLGGKAVVCFCEEDKVNVPVKEEDVFLETSDDGAVFLIKSPAKIPNILMEVSGGVAQVFCDQPANVLVMDHDNLEENDYDLTWEAVEIQEERIKKLVENPNREEQTIVTIRYDALNHDSFIEQLNNAAGMGYEDCTNLGDVDDVIYLGDVRDEIAAANLPFVISIN